jgi:hypothetical protein
MRELYKHKLVAAISVSKSTTFHAITGCLKRLLNSKRSILIQKVDITAENNRLSFDRERPFLPAKKALTEWVNFATAAGMPQLKWPN